MTSYLSENGAKNLQNEDVHLYGAPYVATSSDKKISFDLILFILFDLIIMLYVIR